MAGGGYTYSSGLGASPDPYGANNYPRQFAAAFKDLKIRSRTQSRMRYEKLIKKRDTRRLLMSLGASIYLILMPVSWFFGFDGIILFFSTLGVIGLICTLVWWMFK